jgi:UDP-2-acetamido-2-deoxy-ribo-hexuluronate aminotransferase
MREIRVHGQSRRYVHTRVGVGGRMDTLQCADRAGQARAFRMGAGTALQGRCDATTPCSRDGSDWSPACPRDTSVYAQYTAVVEERERIQAALHAPGIPTAVHYPVPIHMQPAYAHLIFPGLLSGRDSRWRQR